MARYLIFEKTKSFDYKFKGSSSGTNGDKAIKKLKARLSRMAISTQRIYIAIPTSQFMKYQLNPKQKWIVGKGLVTTWKRPK